eukprot:COSAG01_NODE_8899_length_2622_cov_1.191835_3_plen_75_part_00
MALQIIIISPRWLALAASGDVFEIGRRLPHEIEVASSPDGTDPAQYVYVAAVVSAVPSSRPPWLRLTKCTSFDG